MKRGFTLLELLLVLLILGILVGVAMPRYIQSTKVARQIAFESNLNDIIKALEEYKIQQQFQNFAYPSSLDVLKEKFIKEPINPYTNKSMLGGNPTDSGILYQPIGTSYKLCVVQRDVDDVNNNGVVEEVLPLSNKTACIGETTNAIPHSSDGKFVYGWVWDRKGHTNDIVEWITDSSVPSPALHVKRTTLYPANGGCAKVIVEDLLVGNIVPGQNYTISLWFKGNKQSSSIKAQIQLYFRDSNNQLIGSEVTFPISFTDNWQRYVFTVTAPDGAYKIHPLAVGLENINFNDTYEFYIAGLQLE